MGRRRSEAEQHETRAFNKSGQLLGPKGSRTRLRIVEATEKLLADANGVEPTLAEVAGAASISAPTFYLYFTDVGEVVLAVVEQLAPRLDPLLALLDEPWPADQLFQRAKHFVEAYFDYWLGNAPQLRVRNQRADQGDARFVALRMTATDVLIAALSRKIAERPVAGGLPCAPRDTATVLVTALERLATTFVLKLYPGTGDRPDDTVGALANLIGLAVRGG
jgi:AcrR family transcriptional regulator